MRPALLVLLACLLPACAPAPVTAPQVPVTVPPPAGFGCEQAHDADFEGGGERRLQGFLKYLAEAHGAPAGIDPRKVSLGIVRGPAKLAPAGVQAGEVGCGAGSDGPYRVTLYRDALAGRPLALAYETIAHEFHHVVQIHRDRLPCAARDGQREAYEREAREVAQRFVPPCK
jgi:hypothetical protein